MAKKKVETSNDVNTKTATSDKPLFNFETLRKDCLKLFGVTVSTFDGAFYNADKNKEFTLDEAKKHIETWRKKEAE